MYIKERTCTCTCIELCVHNNNIIIIKHLLLLLLLLLLCAKGELKWWKGFPWFVTLTNTKGKVLHLKGFN